MFRPELLRGKISERGTSQRQLALAMGITEKTFYAKMKTDGFSRVEVEEVKNRLELSQSEFDTIFFYLGSDGP